MQLTDAANMAITLMEQHGLYGDAPLGQYSASWSFAWDNARRRFGVCNYRKRTIGLSRALVALNDAAQVRDTILHEIAHALAGPQAKHGYRWQAQARAIGAKPERCYTMAETEMPEAPYYLCCPNGECGRRVPQYRKPKRLKACGVCCKRHAGGRFDRRFMLVLEATR